MVSNLRGECYGDGETYPVCHALHKAPVCGFKFFNAATKFIPQCEGISGTTGALTIVPTYQGEEVGIPIDAPVHDLARFDDEEDDSGVQSRAS